MCQSHSQQSKQLSKVSVIERQQVVQGNVRTLQIAPDHPVEHEHVFGLTQLP